MATTERFDHSNCKHARTGSEGKKARAACRKEHALKAAKVTKTPTRAKAVSTTKAVSTPKPRAPRKVKAVVLDLSDSTVKVDDDLEVPAL